jgi:NitT/TauT family transport system substrate-binding protein
MKRLFVSLVGAALLVPAIAAAEVAEVRLTQQYGLSYLPLVVARTQYLIEKHAKAAGIDDLKTTYVQLGGGAAVADTPCPSAG